MIRTTLTSRDGKVNLHFQKRNVTGEDEGETDHDVVAVAYRNGSGGEKSLGDFEPEDVKALTKML
jgi:hypothetical protein